MLTPLERTLKTWESTIVQMHVRSDGQHVLFYSYKYYHRGVFPCCPVLWPGGTMIARPPPPCLGKHPIWGIQLQVTPTQEIVFF